MFRGFRFLLSTILIVIVGLKTTLFMSNLNTYPAKAKIYTIDNVYPYIMVKTNK